jgi:hypothetical protein
LDAYVKGHASLRPRGTPLRDAACTEHEPTPDPALQPAPAFEFDQRLNW